MNVFEAIEKRRSIRRFKATSLSKEQIDRLMNAARFAPSGSNVQPWRFIIVKKKELKAELRKASFDQKFVEDAPIVIVCCGNLLSWKKTREHVQEILNIKGIEFSEDSLEALMKSAYKAVKAEMHERIPSALLNVAIAV